MPLVRKRVILADPVDGRRQSLAFFLREKEIDVIEVSDGSRALSETLLQKPDILFLDLAVSILSPERLIQILQSNPNTREMPIFFFSDQERSITGFRPGVDQFIRRPFQEEEVLQRIQRLLYKDPFSEEFAGDSEISGSLSQLNIPDLLQMLSMNRKNGILQVEGESASGSIYIERGEIVSASTQNLVGEKALFRMISLKEGKFRFLPGKVLIRRTIFTPNQRVILEGMQHDDELKRIGDDLPSPHDTVELVGCTKDISPDDGVVREVLVLSGFCSNVGEIVDNCHFPDLEVYRALLLLKQKDILRIGHLDEPVLKEELFSLEDLQSIQEWLMRINHTEEEGICRIALFIPEPRMIEDLARSLGKYKNFEADKVFFSLRSKEGFPVGVFGRLHLSENEPILLNVFPYQRHISPLWYSLAPDPVGIVVFLKDGVNWSLENLMAVFEFAKGTSTGALLAVTDKAFSGFSFWKNTLRLFRSRLERIDCVLEVREMEEITPEFIRDCLLAVLKGLPDAEGEDK